MYFSNSEAFEKLAICWVFSKVLARYSNGIHVENVVQKLLIKAAATDMRYEKSSLGV